MPPNERSRRFQKIPEVKTRSASSYVRSRKGRDILRTYTYVNAYTLARWAKGDAPCACDFA